MGRCTATQVGHLRHVAQVWDFSKICSPAVVYVALSPFNCPAGACGRPGGTILNGTVLAREAGGVQAAMLGCKGFAYCKVRIHMANGLLRVLCLA